MKKQSTGEGSHSRLSGECSNECSDDSAGSKAGLPDTLSAYCNSTAIMGVLSVMLLTTAMMLFLLGPPEGDVHRYKKRQVDESDDGDYGGGPNLLAIDERFAAAGRSDRSDEAETRRSPHLTKGQYATEPENAIGSDEATPPTSRSTTTTSAPTVTTTKATTTTTVMATAVPRKPVVRRALLCTVGRHARADTKYPEDGLCDFLFCPVALHANMQFSSFGDAFPGFRQQAAVARNTNFGIDIRTSEMNTTLGGLRTEHGVAAFKNLWETNIRQHGILYPVLSDSVNSTYVDTVIGLLKALRQLQTRFRIPEALHPSYIFVGVAVVLRGNLESMNVKRSFMRIVNEATPDAILLRTHYEDNDVGDHNCRVTGPAVWKGSFSPQQPNFLESLRFLKTVTVPENTAVLLSFTQAVRWYRWDSANESSFTLGEKCACDFHTDLISRHALCSDTTDKGLAAATKHRATQQMHIVHSQNSYGVVYDDKHTMRTKMCWTSTTFGNSFGWAMFDLEFADTNNTCRDPVYVKGFALLRRMKHYIASGFHDPSECDTL